MRAEAGGIRVTVPPYASFIEVKNTVDKYRLQLKSMKEKADKCLRYIDLGYSIETDVMQLHLVEGERRGFYVNRKMGECTIICPKKTDFDAVQEWLRDVVVEQLRIQAKVYLYNRMIEIAKQYGFKYSGMKIQSSHSRWGSCSGNNSINLSLYLMTVPSHLIDYVIKHELCHTVHHDHSSAFWALMDEVTDGRAHELRAELAGYTTEI